MNEIKKSVLDLEFWEVPEKVKQLQDERLNEVGKQLLANAKNVEPEFHSTLFVMPELDKNSPLVELQRRYNGYKKAKGLAEDTIKGVNSLFADIYKFLALITIDKKQYMEGEEREMMNHVSTFPLSILGLPTFEHQFRDFLEMKGLKDTSIATQLIKFAALYRYCSNELEILPPKKFSVKRAEPPIKTLFKDEQIEALLEKPSEKNFAEYRDWVIINYTYNTGNRRRSIANIQMKDLYELDDGYILVQKTKNGKPCRVYVPAKVVQIIKKYIHLWRANATPEDYLFCSQYGEQLSPDNLSHIISRYMKKRLGEDAPSSIHLLRHQYAAEYIRDEGSMFDLQKQLGHSSLKMVKWYADKYGKPNADSIERHSPINRRKQKTGREKLKPNK